jgi:O-antigen ligase
MVFITLDVTDSPQRLKSVLLFLTLGCLVSAGLILYDSMGPSAPSYPWYRPEGGHGDPNYTASTLLSVLPIVFWFMRQGERWRWLVGGASAAFLLLAVGQTVSRTGLAAIVLLLAAQFVALRRRRLGFLLVAVLVLSAIAPLMPWDMIEYRLSMPDTFDRLEKYDHALHVLLRYPLTGGGLGRRGRRTVIFVIHNLFLEVAAQLGLPGLLSMVWLWVTAWRCLWRASKRSDVGDDTHISSLIPAIQVTTLIYFFFSMTLSTHQTRMMWLVLALGAACYRIVKHRYPLTASNTETPRSTLGPAQSIEVR